MTQPTYAITANSLTAETFRQAPASHISGTGVVGSGDLAVAAHGTPNMSVDVPAGQVWVPGTLSSTTGFPTNLNAQTTYGLPSAFNQQSSYFQWYNATTNLAIAAADPTNPRIDLAVVSIQDAQYSGSNNQGILQIITGTPAASPSPPNAPASSVVLAQIAVAAGASSIVTGNITDKRPFVALTAPERGNPAGRMYPTAQTILTSGTTGQITSMTSDFLKGGVTFGSNGLTVPVAGIYVVAAGIAWQNSSNPIAGGIYNTAIYKNGGQARLWTITNAATPSNFNQAFGSDEISLAAGDVLTLEGSQGSGGSAGTVSGTGGGTYLSCALVSQ